MNYFKYTLLIIAAIYLFGGTIFEAIYVIDISKGIPWEMIRLSIIVLDAVVCFAFDLWVLNKIRKYLFNDKFY